MKLIAWTGSLVDRIFRRDQFAEDMEEELRAHIALRADDLERTGLSRDVAERRARIEFGARERYREESYAAMGGHFLENLWRDLRVALRVLRKSPGFTLIAVLTLALAICANSLVFALLNALILHPLKVPQPDTFYGLDHIGPLQYLSYPEYLDLRDRNHTLTGITIENYGIAALDTGSDPVRAWLLEVSGNYFDLIGIHPFLGRFFHAADERGPNSAPYVVLTYAYWHTHFRDDRGVIGRTVRLNKHPFTILGVAPPGFNGSMIIFNPNFWVPIINEQQIEGGQSLLTDRGSHWISGADVRVQPDVSPAQAAADLNAIRLDFNKAWPKFEEKEPYCLVRPGIGGNFIGPPLTAFLTGLMVLAVLILLAACANLGSLFAARASDRSREVALRLALGARRTRVLRQLFTEALLISLAGGAVGLAGSLGLLHALSRWQPFPQFPMNIPVSPDARVYIFALFLALASGFLFGAVPVRQVLRADPYQVVKAAAITGAKLGRISLRDALVVVQIALCAVLVTSSFVALRGLARSLHAHLGFDPQHVMLAETNLQMNGYSDETGTDLERRMLDDARAIPGVTQVALVSNPPLHMGWDITGIYTDQTTDLRPSNEAFQPISYNISPEYFQTAGTALLTGRLFTWNDDKNSPSVTIVNAEFARRLFGSPQKAIGQHFKKRDGSRLQIVGVVEDGKYTANLTESPQPAMFRPLLQAPYLDIWLMVRSEQDPQNVATSMRNVLRNLDRTLPVFIQTWEVSMNGALFAPRMATLSLGVLGMIGAVLSITGIFGMAAYSVSKRMKELGIRVALGARRNEVVRTALGRALRLLAAGSMAGLVLGMLASRVISYIVYQATPRDPVVLAGVVLAMALLGLIATWIPAQRALRVDPMQLLRED
jgi:predicted permease